MMATRMKHPGPTGLLVAIALALSAAATAAQAYSPDQERLCSADAMRLCSAQVPNVEQVTACMRKQKANLSKGCRAVFDK
ncbi:MAG TPA: hypothetical protein VIQ05_16780 [Tardiphaga sp.]